MKDTDRVIINLLKQGDEKAYKYIYDHHYELLCKVASEFLKDHILAETTVSDTIFHLWEIREKLDISVSLISYLVRAVRNRCINYLNSEQVKREISLTHINREEFSIENYFISPDYPLGRLLEKELEHQINDSIEKLPDECREVFMKSRFEEKKYEEIAAEMGISINTVKYHIKNALARLQADLSKREV